MRWKVRAEGLEDTSFVAVVAAVNEGPSLAWVPVVAYDPWDSNGRGAPCLVRGDTCLGARKGANARGAPGAVLGVLVLVLGACPAVSLQIQHC